MKLIIVSGHRSFDKFKPAIRGAASFLAKQLKQEKSYLEVYLVGREFMYKNVLSFPAPKGFPRPDTKLKPLGEIYLNPDFIAKEPFHMLEIRNSKLEIQAKLAYMFIHGFLHLLGYDHKKNSDRIRMEKWEGELLEHAKSYRWAGRRLTQHKSGSR